MRRSFACLSLHLLAAGLGAADFNARVSSRDIALNEVVRCQFSTIRPELEDVDIAEVVHNALRLTAVRERWRLTSPPVVKEHPKIKDVTITFRLQPRESGELPLPTIPVRWMRGDAMARFGSVQVHPGIVVGSERQGPPPELDGVGGFSWGMDLDQIRERVAADQIEAGTPTVVRPRPNITLLLHGGRLTAARVSADELDMDAARAEFIDRWGTPDQQHQSEQGVELVWHIGWLRITASEPEAEQILLRLVHEGIEQRSLTQRVQRQLFDVLERGGDDDAAEQPADHAPGEPSQDEVERELERRMRELQDQQ